MLSFLDGKRGAVRGVCGVGAALWVVLCILYIVYRVEYEKRAAVEELQATMLGQLDSVVERLEGNFREMKNIAKVIALEPSVIRLLESLEPTREARTVLDMSARNAMLSDRNDVLEESAYFQNVVDTTSYLTAFVLDASGVYVCGNILRSPGMLLGRDYAWRRYFREAMQSGSGVEFAVGKNRQELSLFFSEVIKRGERRLGVASVRQGTKFLTAQITVKDAEVMVVDDHGVIVSATRPQWILRRLAPSGASAPTSPDDAFDLGVVEDAGLHISSADGRFMRYEGRNWLWLSQGLQSEKMTVWLLAPEPKSDAVIRYLVLFAILAAVSGVLLIALVERSLEYTLNLKALALHDQLTGLPNRVLLQDRVALALARSRRRTSVVSVLFVDIDRFKQINDTLGHEAGDCVLVEVARRLTASVRASDTVARVGGDEFVVVLENVGRADAEALADKIVEAVSSPFPVGDASCQVGASIGIALAPEDGETLDALLQTADAAMYEVKKRRR